MIFILSTWLIECSNSSLSKNQVSGTSKDTAANGSSTNNSSEATTESNSDNIKNSEYDIIIYNYLPCKIYEKRNIYECYKM